VTGCRRSFAIIPTVTIVEITRKVVDYFDGLSGRSGTNLYYTYFTYEYIVQYYDYLIHLQSSVSLIG
jgi:hypothetical protein